MTSVIWNTDIDVYNPQVMPISVARNIAKYLNIKDLISFSQVSRNTYKTVNNPGLWVSKLKAMDCWDRQKGPDRHMNTVDFFQSAFNSPLTCFNDVVKSNKLAKAQVISIWKCLHYYYDDLLANHSYEKLKVFKEFKTPGDQAKILQNLAKFNKIDLYEESHEIAQDKLNTLFEMFENALLRELEIHYDVQEYDKARSFVILLSEVGNNQTLIDFFLQKTIFDDEESNDFFNVSNFDADRFYTEQQQQQQQQQQQEQQMTNDELSTLPSDTQYIINEHEIHDLIDKLANIFNKESEIIDQIFPQNIPMMYKVCEELITNQLSELVSVLLESSKPKKLYLELVPKLYTLLTQDFIKKLIPSENMGPSSFQLIAELIDMMFETFTVEYIRDEDESFKLFSTSRISEWKNSLTKREQQTVQNILKNVRVENKNDFLSTFRKVFIINSKNNEISPTNDQEISEIEAKTKILSENIKSLNKIFSIELAMDILNGAKATLHRLQCFQDFSISAVRNDVYQGMQVIFMGVVDSVGDQHVKPGFEKALEYLKTYEPNNPMIQNTLGGTSSDDPLVLFTELINMADLIIQMIDFFYKEELINTKIVKVENSISNPSLQRKKKFEGVVDNFVADGLNIGIDILMDQVEDIFQKYLDKSDYNPPTDTTMILDGPTDAARRVVKLLEENIDLLVGCTDKSVVEVYQKEIVERLFQIVVKTLKKNTVSVSGALNLISDLNLYYDFVVEHIRTNRRAITPLFQALKKVGSIFLISGDDSKSIGKLVSDLSKFNGIFTQEEIYEFVHQRADWLLIKRDVEKVMYGLSLGDCTIV